ncbi:VOC family protein [Pseudoduganella ginsengisoli]|uniref:Drug:proton antiporter n=1 Tax=Pseudoduganella ginsengisoli TaxID=1462440 RepID=A0A6L6QA70_9BURK|nr:VOC family protein [Pseudoduganella ginsengisoli]MTW06132.1 drug:proton antiporter [Pseudoduganella ginsengisoli]
MQHPNFLLLYVGSPTASAAFYADLLGTQPVEASPTFAMFALENGMMLGLWAQDTVAPKAAGGAGGGELAFAVESDATVNERHLHWIGKGIVIAQAPTRMDFGYTFVGLDPDGHRLRVFAPNQP